MIGEYREWVHKLFDSQRWSKSSDHKALRNTRLLVVAVHGEQNKEFREISQVPCVDSGWI